jgi:hypothetical protein
MINSLLSLTSNASLQRGDLQSIDCCWTPVEIGAVQSAMPLSGGIASIAQLTLIMCGDCMEKR